MSAGRRLLAVADALPVTVLAVIAGAASFTHIRDTAAQHGQTGPMSWAVAVSIDLTCVIAARERHVSSSVEPSEPTKTTMVPGRNRTTPLTRWPYRTRSPTGTL